MEADLRQANFGKDVSGVVAPEGLDAGPCEMCCVHGAALAIKLQTRMNPLEDRPKLQNGERRYGLEAAI